MTTPARSDPLRTSVYQRLRTDLVSGVLPPGGKLKPQILAHGYAASPAALREALLRLASEGFVTSAPQRGFSAARPNPETVWEIAHFRILIETEGARLSILHGDVRWEANLLAAHHRLSHLEGHLRGGKEIEENLRLWSSYDRAFHEALIGACGSDLLKDQHRISFDRFKQHVIAQDATLGFRGEELVREHGDILTSALDRDPLACAKALRLHFETYKRFSDAVIA
ncbi:MAG: GntR family transcriptional regulator [Pseudomonadota bacterium]